MTYRAALLALCSLALTGCFELSCESLLATVDWDPDAATFHVDMVLQNIDVDMLECADAPTCVQTARRLVAPADADLPTDAKGLWTARALAEDGASGVTASLERRGDLLDLRIVFTAPVNGDAVDPLDMYVLQEGRPGKERPTLVVVLEPGDRITPEKGRRFAYHDVDDDEDVELWFLPRKVRSVTVHRQEDDDIEPPLRTIEGLEAALVAEGLIPAAAAAP